MNFEEETAVKKQFGKFLIGFILKGHTVSQEALHEIDELTDEYLKSVPPYLYFDDEMVMDYIDYLEENMTDENKGYPHLYFKASHYIDMLKSYIQHYIQKIVRLNKEVKP